MMHWNRNGKILYNNKLTYIKINLSSILKVRGPFVQTLCIEKDSYMDPIYRVNIFR